MSDDSNFGPKHGGGDREKTYVKQAAEQEELTNFGRTKRQQISKGYNDRGAGLNTVRQRVLYFAEFVINALNKYSSLFKTVFILLQHFLFPSLQYQMNGKN